MAEASLPHCDDLFQRYFDRWYEGVWREREYPATRPDLERRYPPGSTAVGICRLDPEGRPRVEKMLATMISACRGDWPRYLKVKGSPDLEWIRAFDQYYTRDRISKILAKSDPADFSNEYIVLCCEFGVMLGEVMIGLGPELQWVHDWPYWESFVFHPKTGERINVFHWAVKKMSEYGVDDGFAEKIQACIEMLKNPPQDEGS